VVAAAVVAAVLVASGGGPRHRQPRGGASSASTRSNGGAGARPNGGAGTSTTPTQPGPTATQPTALPAPSGEELGVNVNRLFNDFAYTPAQIDAQLAAVRATGATIARSDALWEATEPHAPAGGRHDWKWSFDDQIAGSLAAHGLTWLPILDYTAPWAQSIRGQDHSPPRSDAGYAAYAAAFAARYGSGGTFWHEHSGLTARPVGAIEIWNEPDNGQFWEPSPDPGAYAQLYLAARAAIDAADPGIRVLVGGLTKPASFLPAMAQAAPGLSGHIDGVAIHPYGRPAVVAGKVASARSTLMALGMAKVPLYVTEFGWTTQPASAPDYAPESVRPSYIERTLAELAGSGCGVAASLLYTWVTPERDPTDAQDWYGIADPSSAASPTPDTTAFAAGLHAAAGMSATSSTPAPCAG
ncbi:MAG: hypothetical protein ACRDLV_06275, partial [Solirubrobacteraceae bacterium]